MPLFTHLMERRRFLTGLSTSVLLTPTAAKAALLPVPASLKMRFKIFRNGSYIGEQVTTFTQDGTTLKVESHADMVVRIVGIPVFHYQANVIEYWLDGEFHQLNSQVNHNGEQRSVLAHKIPDGFAIESTRAGDYIYTGAQKMMPMTYWNKAMLESMILDVETGHHYPAIVNSPGWERLSTVEGGKILAQRFDVTGHLHFTVWYDQEKQWSGLAFHVDGQEMFQKYSS